MSLVVWALPAGGAVDQTELSSLTPDPEELLQGVNTRACFQLRNRREKRGEKEKRWSNKRGITPEPHLRICCSVDTEKVLLLYSTAARRIEGENGKNRMRD